MNGADLTGKTILFLVTEDWYFCSHRLPLGRAARDAGANVVVATRVNEHHSAIAAEGFSVMPIRFDRSGLNPVKDWRTLSEIRQAYRTVKPDLVHHVGMKPVLYGTLAARLTGVPAIVNAMAGMGFLFTSEAWTARLLRGGVGAALKFLQGAEHIRVIVQNDDDRHLVETVLGVAPAKIRVIRGAGVDVDAFAVQPEPAGPLIAVSVSRMLWHKGIGELVEAARLLKERGVRLTIRLIGPSDANPASIPEATLAGWAEEGIVEVAGPTSDVGGAYGAAHIAVLPSYREGLPKSLLEAAACGRAMVATDVPGCREICRDGETGLLVPVRDAAALADALARLADDPVLRQKLGKRAREVAVSEFSDRAVAAETLSVYRELI